MSLTRIKEEKMALRAQNEDAEARRRRESAAEEQSNKARERTVLPRKIQLLKSVEHDFFRLAAAFTDMTPCKIAYKHNTSYDRKRFLGIFPLMEYGFFGPLLEVVFDTTSGELHSISLRADMRQQQKVRYQFLGKHSYYVSKPDYTIDETYVNVSDILDLDVFDSGLVVEWLDQQFGKHYEAYRAGLTNKYGKIHW